MRHRYPFETLHWLRQQRVERHSRALGESVQRAACARVAADRAEAVRRDTERQIANLADTERARLEEGLVRACDLGLVADWQKGAESELATKTEFEQRAREAQAAAAAAEATARRSLASASNEAKIIDTHRDTFRAQRAAEQDRAEEELATEQWTASHFSRRG
ncbi:MAG TPA: hypothetical protein VER11_25320 [Polyangiaceae bacterium]|nr:hypothetical protein [Polyangiaceae bacterium]